MLQLLLQSLLDFTTRTITNNIHILTYKALITTIDVGSAIITNP